MGVGAGGVLFDMEISTLSTWCTICNDHYDIPTTSSMPPLPYKLPHWNQLCSLLGGVELNLPFCATCYAQVNNLVDKIRRIEALQFDLRLGVAGLREKITENRRPPAPTIQDDNVEFDSPYQDYSEPEQDPEPNVHPAPPPPQVVGTFIPPVFRTRGRKRGRKPKPRDNEENEDEDDSLKKKPRKPHRRLTPSEIAIMLQKRKEADADILGPFVETEDGRTFYEGYEVLMVDGFYTCATCGFKENLEGKPNWRKTKVIKGHIRSKHRQAYRCDPCERNFTTLRGLTLHLSKTCPYQGNAKLEECSVCGKPVPEMAMATHLWTHKSQKEKDIASAKGQQAVFNCHKCLKPYLSKSSLWLHQNRSRHPCRGRGTQPKPTNDDDDGTTPDDPPFSLLRQVICPTCGRTIHPHYLSKHEWTHKSVEEREDAIRLGQAPKGFVATARRKPALLPELITECPICGKPHTGNHIQKHIDSHKGPHEIVRLSCTRQGCNKTYKNKYLLTQHVRLDHDDPSRTHIFTCPVPGCSLTFLDGSSFQKHRKRHRNQRDQFNNVCSICHASYRTRLELVKHKRKHRPAAEYTLLCSSCPQLFATQALLKNHMSRIHGERVEKKTPKVKLDPSGSPKKKKRVPCPTCGRSLHPHYLPKHEWSHKSLEEQEEAIHIKALAVANNPLPTECAICGKPTNKQAGPSTIKLHTETHLGPHELTRVKCSMDGCCKTFKTSYKMYYHVKVRHEGKQRALTCAAPECSLITFVDRKAYRRHRKRHKTQEDKLDKRHLCNICHANFPSKRNLLRHTLKHRPAEDYVLQCPSCPQLLVNQKTLSYHLTKQHRDDGVEGTKKERRTRSSRPVNYARLALMESSESESDQELQDPFMDIPDDGTSTTVFRNELTSDDEHDSEEEEDGSIKSEMDTDYDDDSDQIQFEEDISEDNIAAFMEDEIKEEDEDYS